MPPEAKGDMRAHWNYETLYALGYRTEDAEQIGDFRLHRAGLLPPLAEMFRCGVVAALRARIFLQEVPATDDAHGVDVDRILHDSRHYELRRAKQEVRTRLVLSEARWALRVALADGTALGSLPACRAFFTQVHVERADVYGITNRMVPYSPYEDPWSTRSERYERRFGLVYPEHAAALLMIAWCDVQAGDEYAFTRTMDVYPFPIPRPTLTRAQLQGRDPAKHTEDS